MKRLFFHSFSCEAVKLGYGAWRKDRLTKIVLLRSLAHLVRGFVAMNTRWQSVT